MGFIESVLTTAIGNEGFRCQEEEVIDTCRFAGLQTPGVNSVKLILSCSKIGSLELNEQLSCILIT